MEVQQVAPGRPNVIGSLGEKTAGRAEPAPRGPHRRGDRRRSAPTGRWPPFGADMVDGRIYGRGTADMKSGLAAAMVAAAAFIRAGVDAAGQAGGRRARRRGGRHDRRPAPRRHRDGPRARRRHHLRAGGERALPRAAGRGLGAFPRARQDGARRHAGGGRQPDRRPRAASCAEVPGARATPPAGLREEPLPPAADGDADHHPGAAAAAWACRSRTSSPRWPR